MSFVLSIETATTAGSVALFRDKQLLAQQTLLVEQSHSSMLTSLIDHVLFQTQTAKEDLSAVAISEGPGSYTGLRIGTATAKGLCFALNIPLLAVPTLQAMAVQVLPYLYEKDVILCPMIDARRMEVYTALYNTQGEELQTTEALVIDENSFKEKFPHQKIIFFGNGAAKCQKVLTDSRFVFVEGIYPQAYAIGQLAIQVPKEVSLAYFEPFYLKEHYTPTKNK